MNLEAQKWREWERKNEEEMREEEKEDTSKKSQVIITISWSGFR